MAIVRWDPFSEMQNVHDQLFRAFEGAGANRNRGGYWPPVDVQEDPERITLRADVAGMTPKDIHVSIDNNVLTIEGERKLEDAEKREGLHRVERVYGTFSRSFVLPQNIDTEHVAAETKDGVLTLRIPKKPVAKGGRKIEVKG